MIRKVTQKSIVTSTMRTFQTIIMIIHLETCVLHEMKENTHRGSSMAIVADNGSSSILFTRHWCCRNLELNRKSEKAMCLPCDRVVSICLSCHKRIGNKRDIDRFDVQSIDANKGRGWYGHMSKR